MKILKFLLSAICTMAVCTQVTATVLFDNGTVNTADTTWNDTGSQGGWTIYDDFVLTSSSTITDLTYHIFTTSPSTYSNTKVFLFNGGAAVLGSAVIPAFTVTGSQTSNGLHSTNSVVPDGYDITLSGLSILLDPGTYTLGLSTYLTGSSVTSIGSGSGSAQTIGSGLYQGVGAGYTLHNNDHMAFTLIGTTGTVPEPTSIALLGLGLFGFAAARRRKQ
jgi:hypothetical protein